MDWISIAANLGVLAGLILVAIQIRQSSAALQGSAYETWLAANVELNAASTQMNSRIFLAGNLDSRDLNEETYTHFAMWYFSFFQMVQTTDYLYKKGSLDRGLWNTELGRAALLLSFPGVRQLWDGGIRTQLAPEFVALVEALPSTQTGFGWDPEQGFHGVRFTELPAGDA